MQLKIFTSLVLVSLALVGAGCASSDDTTSQGSLVSQKIVAPKSEETAIENTGLVELSADNNTVVVTIPQDKVIAEDLTPIFKEMGDGKDKAKNQKTIELLGNIISKYPEYSDVYLLRATISLLVDNVDHQQVLSDIDNAIKYHSSSKYSSAYDSEAEMYVLKAKVEILDKSFDKVMINLETAVKIDPSNTNQVFNTGGVKPEDISNPSALQNNELDVLVQKYPMDYRSYMFRGLFYRSFTFFDEQYFTPTLNNLRRAQELNPNSALVEYLLGSTYQRGLISTKAAWSDISDIIGEKGGYREKAQTVALQHYLRAIELDPSFVLAYAGAAESLFSLKQFADAIPYYDKELQLNPNNAGAYNDRGLAKDNTNDHEGAIADFTRAIELKKSKPDMIESSYENRATAYMKLGKYDNAIEDYSHAIGKLFSSTVLLMSVSQIRQLYPELNNIADKDLLEGLRQKYFSGMSKADFVDSMNKNTKPNEYFVLGNLYVSRGDVYLHKGDFDQAQKEYARADVFNSFPVDGWKKSSALQACLEKTDDPLGVNGGDQQGQRQNCLDQLGSTP